jgi:hypothetical protein
VNHVQRSAGQVGDHDRPVGGLFLHLPGPRDPVVVRAGLAGRVQLLGEDVDRRAVLGVHHGQQPGFSRLLHRLEDLRVVGVEDTRVGHEQLEARHTLVDQRVHGLERELVEPADDLVEPVVDRAIAGALACQVARPSSTRSP